MTRPRFRDMRRSVVYLRPHASTITLVIAVTLACSGLTAIEPMLHKAIFDSVAAPAENSLRALALPLILLALLVTTRQVGEAVSTQYSWRARLRINRHLLSEATARLHELPLSYHQSKGIGDTMTRLDRGITNFMEALSSIAFQVLPAAGYLGLSLYFMLKLSPTLALIALVFVLPPLIWGRSDMSGLVSLERANLDRWCRIYDRFQQVLAGMKTVKSFAREEEEQEHFIHSVKDTQREVLRSIRLQTKLGARRGLSVQIGRVAVLGAGALLAHRGEIGLGSLVAFLGYLGGLYTAAQSLLGLYESLRRAELGLATFFSVIDAENAVPDKRDPILLPSLEGHIRLENLSFRYEGAERPALEGIDCDIEKGEMVAIVGASGAGKTTLADLILRFYDPDEGRVTIDGVDIRELSQRALRAQVGVVSQEPFLFDDTVMANLRYGRPHATMNEIERAVSAANAKSFIEGLPRGYETKIGRGGVALSGGERQRLAIARTILKDPSIVILDEPTSALDVEAETAVQSAIEELAFGRTTIFIAHRLNTTLRADRVLLLEGGRLVQNGSPAELLAIDGPYRRLMSLWRKTHRKRKRPTPPRWRLPLPERAV